MAAALAGDMEKLSIGAVDEKKPAPATPDVKDAGAHLVKAKADAERAKADAAKAKANAAASAASAAACKAAADAKAKEVDDSIEQWALTPLDAEHVKTDLGLMYGRSALFTDECITYHLLAGTKHWQLTMRAMSAKRTNVWMPVVQKYEYNLLGAVMFGDAVLVTDAWFAANRKGHRCGGQASQYRYAYPVIGRICLETPVKIPVLYRRGNAGWLPLPRTARALLRKTFSADSEFQDAPAIDEP